MKAKEKSPFALDNALAVYGIHKNPFPIDESDDFFFSTANLGKQLDALHNLVGYGDLLLVVSGVQGAGKTTLLNQVLRASDARWNCCRIDAHPSMRIDSLVDELLTGFGVKARGDDAKANKTLLRMHLEQVHAQNHIALLAVDDAHLMPQSCVEFLLGLAEQGGAIELRLVLTAEPGRLGFSTSDPKRVHVVVLKPLDVQQCGDYLNTRLSYAGLVGDSPFDASVVEEIHRDSGGIPGEIHPLAVRTLIANADTSKPRRRLPMTRRTAAYLGLMLVVAVAVASLLETESELDESVIEDPGATGVVKGRIAAATPSSESVVVVPVGTGAEAAQSLQSDFSAESAGATKAMPSEPTRQAVATTEDEVKVFSLEDDRPSTIAAVAVTSPARDKDVTSATDDLPAIGLAKNVTPATAPAAARAIYDLDWLRQQNSSHYVIQLVGTRKVSIARKFVDNHELGDKGVWIATSHQDKPWYVVVYGIYPDKASARAAIGDLPGRLRAGSPWPRSVASVVENAR